MSEPYQFLRCYGFNYFLYFDNLHIHQTPIFRPCLFLWSFGSVIKALPYVLVFLLDRGIMCIFLDRLFLPQPILSPLMQVSPRDALFYIPREVSLVLPPFSWH